VKKALPPGQSVMTRRSKGKSSDPLA
jgi:hypothetical protein